MPFVYSCSCLFVFLPSDTPGPDGFNTNFVKKCWPIIKADFYAFCDAFHNGSICLHSINGSYITLIPKVDAPSKAGDFRPISLLNTSVKILTKLLSIRLQKVITQLVHQNQYGFIKGRTIQLFVAWAHEYLDLCHRSKRRYLSLNWTLKRLLTKWNTTRC